MGRLLTKLTLSAPPDIIAQAHALAKQSGQSISAMFAIFIRACFENQFAPMDSESLPVHSCAAQALKIGQQSHKVSDDWNYKDELTNILCEKYHAENAHHEN